MGRILTASNKSVSVFRGEGKYYFADSHSCGPKGKPTPENGKACVIECDNLQELCRICKRCLGSRNIAYTLTRVDVHLRENIITRQGVQVQQQEDAITYQDIQVQQPLLNLRSETIPIQTSVMLPIDSVQPDVEDELEVSENINEIRRKTDNNIVNEAYELKAEEFAWYQLFPYGKNGLKEQRPRNDYIFYALSMFEYYRVKSTIAACARKVEGENGNRVEDLHLYLKNLRGSAAYWRSALSDLIAQIRCLGPPTYFVTLSCNDLHWKDMKRGLLVSDSKQHIDPDDIDIQETQRLIEMYPVVVSRHFMAEQRYKVLKFNEAGQAAGYCANIFERYEKRPAEHPNYDFNNMCLIEFAMLFEPHYTKPPVINEESIDTDAYAPHEQTTRRRLITLTDNTKMTIRNTPAVVRVPNFIAASDPESYYYSLLIQYMPYRNETELLGEFNSARDAFLANEESLRQTNAYLEIYRERDRQLENAFAQVHAFQILEHAEPMELDHEEEVPYLPMNEDQFSQAKQSMNAGQKEIFTLVTQSIQNQMSGAEERLRIFFTGGAGVGKTFLLKLLRDQINRCYAKDAVKVCSLTGVAARLINGATIHSTLKLPVQKDGRITAPSTTLRSTHYAKALSEHYEYKFLFIMTKLINSWHQCLQNISMIMLPAYTVDGGCCVS
ncbi:hypothetical protein HW555_011413 [Spodoptera exigua]|uniref:ATP-dependent DNA helicase n=1 Tax=Spodoptera exigua TaxID=7107 RepID=A0A835G5F6_SPOEX|nr:hypothetical protein HW555_011413 [Spodoptera exigua]